MKRELIPGMWGRCGRAIPDPQASELDNVVPMCPDYRQGRDSKTPVPPVSMYAGKPGDFDSADELLRDTAWKVLAVLLTCGWILALIYWAPKLLDMLVGFVPEAQ